MQTIKENAEELKTAADMISQGKVIIVPCDTLYGFVTNALNEQSVRRIYDIKSREPKKPLGIFINKDDIPKYAYTDELAEKVIDLFLPGPLNLVLKKKDTVPSYLTCGSDSVMIMCYESSILQGLYNSTGIPMASSSCNVSGEPPATKFEEALQFQNDADLIIDGGATKHQVNGTIIDLTDTPRILRTGAFPIDKIKEVIPTL